MTQAATRSFEETFLIDAPRPRVFEALTSREALRAWFAEHVHIEAREGGRFGFWGRFTPLASAGEGTQRLTRFEPGRALAFSWLWNSEETTCTLECTDQAAGTALRVHHVARSEVGFKTQESCWLARDFWLVSIGNLRSYLRSGAASVRPDYSAPGPDASVEIEIDASSSTVWRVLTTPELMAQWLAGDKDYPAVPRAELRVGGAYSFGWTMNDAPIGPSSIIELEPGRRLRHTWSEPNTPSRATEWILEPLGPSRTRLSVRQIGTNSEWERSAYKNGWAAFLHSIAKVTQRA
jgi:uncharacterized protein YndB with AHSA1/START domain